jgi:hypothetical protein
LFSFAITLSFLFVFLQISPLFFYSNYGFCNFVILVNIRFPLLLFLIYFAAEKYYGHVLWRSCEVFDSTIPPHLALPKMQMMKALLKLVLHNLQQDLASHWQPL